MDFITWWFDVHYIWSTLITPFLTFLWCIFKGEFWRGVLAFVLSVCIGFGRSKL